MQSHTRIQVHSIEDYLCNRNPILSVMTERLTTNPISGQPQSRINELLDRPCATLCYGEMTTHEAVPKVVLQRYEPVPD